MWDKIKTAWGKFKKYLGYAWASPVTLFGLYAVAFKKFGWYKFLGVRGDALVYIVDTDRAPDWLLRLWKNWAGHAVGNVVVLFRDPTSKPQTLTHELKHVSQCMKLGVFQPLVYGASYLAIKFGCPGSDPYLDNPFEIDARRAAGQVIDVVGALQKLKNQEQKK